MERKTTTVLAMLHWLGVKPSYSGPRVSDNKRLRREPVPHGHYRAKYLDRDIAGAPVRRRLRALVQP